MADWVVSMHGCSYAQQMSAGSVKNFKGHQLIKIPSGITIYFYVKERAIFNQGWPLFNLLMGSPSDIAQARSQAVEVRRSSEAVPDYTLSGDDSWQDGQGSASGVFLAGNRNSVQTWLASGADSWTLSHLLTYCSPGDNLYWLACRAWA